MKNEDFENGPDELSGEDFKEFLSATGDARWKILLAHAERNKKTLLTRKQKEADKAAFGEVKRQPAENIPSK